jgi:hypothetical protein
MPRGLVALWLFQHVPMHTQEIEQHCPIHPVASNMYIKHYSHKFTMSPYIVW